MSPPYASGTRLGGMPVSRRRALALFGAAAGLPLASLAAPPRTARDRAPTVYEWRGHALGATARLALAHPDREAVRRVVARCVDEIARLERIFSLHRPDSELVGLNRDGRLGAASHDLRILLAESRRFSELSGGAFDVTVQPLWRLYVDHFRRDPGATGGPGGRILEAARRLVDYRAIDLGGGAAVTFRHRAMAATLNGIAQGYITDRVADLLRDSGFDSVLVQLGETFASAPPTGRDAWRVGVPDPVAASGPGLATLDLVDRAVATSSGRATPFDRAGRHHHLLDPRTGLSAGRYLAVAVVARRAVAADALSTALSILPDEAAGRLLAAAGGEAAVYLFPDGRRRTVTA